MEKHPPSLKGLKTIFLNTFLLSKMHPTGQHFPPARNSSVGNINPLQSQQAEQELGNWEK